MRTLLSAVVAAMAVAAAVTGCSSNVPSQPSGGTSSVTAPRPTTPPSGSVIRNVDQPVNVAFQNAPVTAGGAATYAVQVATDVGFSNVVVARDDIVEGSGGQTTVRLDTLAGGRDYFWRARATSGGTTGVYGTVSRFTVGPAVTIQAPLTVSPLSNSAVGARPPLVVRNADRSSGAGPLTYKFEVATSAAFSSIALTSTVSEGATQTAFTPTADLSASTTYFWRVTVIDAQNGVSSAPSTPVAFTTSLAIDLTKVVYLNSPNVSGWPQTGTLTLVEQDGSLAVGALCTAFTDPGWPDVPFFGDPNFGVFANQWFFANIGGTWYGGAAEWLYRGVGSCKYGQGTTTMGPDSGFGPPVSTWAPRVGELVGYMVTTPARAGMRGIDQRTNVVVQPWVDSSR